MSTSIFTSPALRRAAFAAAAAMPIATMGPTRSYAAADTSSKPAAAYAPPAKIESLYAATEGNKFAGLNSPIAGARTQAELPRGQHSFQLHSLATPNGQKVGIMLEELEIEYDAHVVDIMKGEQFSSGFVAINPNSKIPAAVDFDGPGGKEVHLSESASIVLYLAKKYNRLYPKDELQQIEAMNWVFWQMAAQGPMSGNLGHFMVYAPDSKGEARDYGIARYGMEVQRLLSVLELHLKERTYMVGEEYSVADIMLFPWFQQIRKGYIHKASGVSAASMLSVEQNYPHVIAWADRINERPAVQRGMRVCRPDSW